MFVDKLTFTEGVTIELGCGHPNVKAGETCPACGQQVPPQEEETQNEQTQEGNSG